MILATLRPASWRRSPSPTGPRRSPSGPTVPPASSPAATRPPVAKDYWVRNIHNPSITAFLPPKEKATGAAVVICPGGGHRELVFNAEGVEPARYFNGLGVAAFVLKYRLGREQGSPYKPEVHAREDGLRAMRLVRSRAAEWGLDPPAGRHHGLLRRRRGRLDGRLRPRRRPTPTAADPIDRLASRPDFLIEIYPGALGIPETSSPRTPPRRSSSSPTTTAGAARVIAGLFQKYRDAGAPVEAHVFARGGHAFNMGSRAKLETLRNWPQRLADWMNDAGILDPSKRPDSDRRKSS